MAIFFEDPPIVGGGEGNDEIAGIDYVPSVADGLDFPPAVGSGPGNDEIAGLDYATGPGDASVAGIDYTGGPGNVSVAGIDYYNDPSSLPANPLIQEGDDVADFNDENEEYIGGSQGVINSIKAQAGPNNTAYDPPKYKDWRVKLGLAKGLQSMYTGLLQPLASTEGIIFPYTPSIQVQYSAAYDQESLVHTNYKVNQYRSSSIESVMISCDFTAQDTSEANYVLATIHFLKTVTKMFYGQEGAVPRGTPPPLCYLTGMGEYQFNNHPLAITSFSYNLPTDVDYIRADLTESGSSPPAQGGSAEARLGSNLVPGGYNATYNWAKPKQVSAPTYIPTRIQIQIQCIPIHSRNEISNVFSLQEYSKGSLIKRGIW